jgi:hypothetical protein
LFATGAGEFTARVAKGQFTQLLEIHLTQYAVAPDWEGEWAASRYHRSGMLAGYGSIGTRSLHRRLDLALNLAPTERLQLRYDQRRWTDTRFDLHEERFDLLWWAVPGAALLASGWPTPQKQYAALGLGCAFGQDSGDTQLVALVRDDRYLFDQKTDSTLRFTRQPLRLLLDGSTGGDTWRAYTSLNLGTAYAAEDRAGEHVTRAAAGRLQYGDAGAVWRRGPVHASLSGRFAAQDRAEDREGARTLSLDRDWWRLDATLEFAPGDWAGAVLGGYSRQRDRFFSAADVDGEYRARSTLFGTEGIYRGWRRAELRLGYVGSVFAMERTRNTLGPAPPSIGEAKKGGYRDKAHLLARYRFHPSLALEALLSKEVSRGSFGGFAVRALGRL